MYPAHFDSLPGSDAVPLHVLLAEDEFLIRLDLAESIRALGWIVVEVSTADEAIELIRAKVRFDLVVTDVKMPGHTDGRDLARLVRQTDPATKVVLVTSEPQRSAEDGDLYDLFLRKPVWNIGPHLIPLMRRARHAD